MQKRRSADKVNYVFFFIILQRLYFVQIHTFWKLLHVFFVNNILGAIVRATRVPLYYSEIQDAIRERLL